MSDNPNPIKWEDTSDGFTVATRPLAIRILAVADRTWTDNVYVQNAFKRYQRAYVIDFIIRMDLQVILAVAAAHLNIPCVEYERDMASFLGFVDNVDRIIRQAQPTHILHFSDYLDNDEAVYLRKKAKREKIAYEIVNHN